MNTRTRWVSGVTPMASSTMSERSGSLSSSSVSTESPSCRNLVTVSPNRRATPCLRISAWTKLAISVSSGANSCFGRWTMVTEMPISTRFSAISRPIKPPPAKTAIFRLLILYKAPDAVGVLHCAQGKDPLTVHAGKRRNRRLCAGGEEQLVIGFRIALSAVQCADGDGFFCGIDRSYFLPYPYINAKAVPEALRSLQRQFFLLLDHTAHIIRQTAVGIGQLRSIMMICACSSKRRMRAAEEAPPATPPTITTFILRPPPLRQSPT